MHVVLLKMQTKKIYILNEKVIEERCEMTMNLQTAQNSGNVEETVKEINERKK